MMKTAKHLKPLACAALLACGLSNISDAIAYPRAPGSAEF